MDKRQSDIKALQDELGIRVAALEYVVEESVVQLFGALVVHLAKNGRVDLKALEDDLRSDFDPDLATEDSTGVLYSRLAELVSFYRHDGLGRGRCEIVYEKGQAS